MTVKKFPTDSSPLDAIRFFLRSAELRLRLWGLLETVLWVAALLCVVLLLGIGVRALRDFWAFSPPVYAGLAAGLGLWALLRLIWGGVRRIPAERVAFLIEKDHPELNNALISSVQLTTSRDREGGGGPPAPSAPPPPSSALVGALLKKTADAIRPLDPGDAVDRSRLRRPLLAAGVMGALTLAVGLGGTGALAGSWRLLLHPIEEMPVRAIVIETTPLSGKILLGRPVTIRAVASGRRTESLWVEIAPEGGRPRVVRMMSDGEGPGGERKFVHETGPVRSSFSYRAFVGGDASGAQRLEAVPPPAVGEIEVAYAYPRYARLRREVRRGSGYVRALKGTEVTLSVRTNKPVESGRLVFSSGVEVPLDLSDPARPRGRFIVMEKDAYRIVLRDRWGFENPDPARYSVDVVPDEVPSIEWIQPQSDLTVSGRETIGIGYLARDDFGLEEIRLVAEVAGEGRLEFLVTKMDAAKRWETGRYEWDLRGLRLRPGAVVRARLVARDNDAISGPKEGVSKTLLIRLRSPEAEHKRVEDEQKNIADGLVNLLGDQLELEAEATEKLGESPDGLPDGKKGRGARADAAAGKSAKPPVRFSRKDADDLDRKAKDIEEAVQGLIARIDRALSRVARDPRSGFDSFADLNALRGNLSYLQREMMPRARRPLEGARQGANDPPDGLRRFQAAQREITRELERMAVFADDIGKRGRLRDLANLGRRLSEAQNRLLDALDRAKPGDTEAERALREALKKVQELLNKMARALRNLPTQLPDEFMNMPTAQALNLGDLSKKLREIRRRLAAGDLEGAKKLADELVKSLSRMIAALRGALQQAMSQASGRFGRSARRQQSVLQQLLNRQRALLEETRKIEKPVARRFREMQAEAFERAGKMAKEAVETLRRLGREVRLPPAYYRPSGEPHGEEEADALERSLSRREVPEAAGAASELRDLSREVAEALSEKVEGGPAADEKRASSAYRKLGEDFDALLSALRNLPKDPRVILTPAQRARLAELETEQKAVEGKTAEVRSRIERIMRLLPFLSPEIAENLRKAEGAMGRSGRELGERRADRAVPHERDAIYWLGRAGSNMRGAMQQMARRGRFGGAPAPSVIQPGGQPMVVMRPRPDVGEEEGGRMGASTRDFRLPDKDAYKVPKVYREEVVEALKSRYPPAYREQIEQYFKNLVE